ncbi:Golgi-associated kinase 1A [Notamacropus eugenii]|uniref:Golgi-associated kinase 1A n=1 Tax=Notamacropus eugenii TaxID=9315 RepID=UPI003B672059
MASRLWRRLRGKRLPLTGFCFFLALSVAALTGFSPGLPAHGPAGSAKSSSWAGQPFQVMEAIPLGSPRALSSRQGRRLPPMGPWEGWASLKNSSLVCKDDRGSKDRGRQGRPHPSRYQGRAKRNAAAAAATITTNLGDSSSHLGMTRNIPVGRKGARGQKAKGPLALTTIGHRDHLPELPVKEISPGTHLEGATFTSLLEDSRATLHDPDVQTVGAEKEAWGRGASLSAGSTEGHQGSVWCHNGVSGGHLEEGEIPPWFTADDVWKMRLLARGEVMGRARIPGHGQVLRVGLSMEGTQNGLPPDLGQLCSEGLCGLIKRPKDLYEVLAFHLDRVLGLHRSLPVVARHFHSPLLPYRFTRGEPRPVVWWAPDIQHLNDSDRDQNSFALGWLQYQALLRLRCGVDGSGAPLREAPCLGIHHTEWARLALFDFLLQVHDRLDRYCCGFQPEPSDPCLEEGLREKCRNPGELLLVHILVQESDPSHLVYIDNAGKPSHPETKLNFRLLEGIDGFPESVVRIIASGCLENMLLKSLRMDPEFWESQGGHQGLKPLLRTIQRRGQILLEYIQGRNLTLFREATQEGDQVLFT